MLVLVAVFDGILCSISRAVGLQGSHSLLAEFAALTVLDFANLYPDFHPDGTGSGDATVPLLSPRRSHLGWHWLWRREGCTGRLFHAGLRHLFVGSGSWRPAGCWARCWRPGCAFGPLVVSPLFVIPSSLSCSCHPCRTVSTLLTVCSKLGCCRPGRGYKYGA